VLLALSSIVLADGQREPDNAIADCSRPNCWPAFWSSSSELLSSDDGIVPVAQDTAKTSS